MKNRRQLFGTLLLTVMAGLAGCSDGTDDYDGPESGVIWDVYPYSINIVVTDKAGNDLLNPATEGSIADKGIKAIMGEYVFEKDSLAFPPSKTRAIQTIFYGLSSFQMSDGRYALSFGEFTGSADRTPTDFYLDWNDGTPLDTITFSNSFWWEEHRPHTELKVWLNGEETDVPVHIVK